MKKQLLFCLFVFLLFSEANAQDSFAYRAQKYIEQYSDMAVAEQRRSGVPASVTLGQGILETEAGRSELVCMANNHFGIKCKNDYRGEVFLHDDDAPKERFMKYRSAEESYKDHSEHLKRNQRYAPLFSISKTDYAGWAMGLKKCGYATNPQYAQRLIKIIEDFKLQEYTYTAMDTTKPLKRQLAENIAFRQADTLPKTATGTTPVKAFDAPLVAGPAPKPTFRPQPLTDTVKKVATMPAESRKGGFGQIKRLADSTHHIVVIEEPMDKPMAYAARPQPKIPEMPADTPTVEKTTDNKFDSGKVIFVNGLKAFYANKGEMLLQYAVKYNIRYPHLLEINDLPDAPLASNMLVYLEKKLTSGTHARHTVTEGETMFMISQAEGMQLKRLLSLNLMEAGEEPVQWSVLELQEVAKAKPALRPNTQAQHTAATNTKTKPVDTYIAIKHEKPAETAATKVVDMVNTTTNTMAHTAAATQNEKPTEVITAAKTEVAHETPAKPTTTATMKADTAKDELDALKAELDKVVYTDDSKLIGKPTTTPANPLPKLDLGQPTAPVTPKPAKPKPAAPAASSHKYYTVKKGDTISGIAKKNGVTIKQILKWNDIDPDDISINQKLKVSP